MFLRCEPTVIRENLATLSQILTPPKPFISNILKASRLPTSTSGLQTHWLRRHLISSRRRPRLTLTTISTRKASHYKFNQMVFYFRPVGRNGFRTESNTLLTHRCLSQGTLKYIEYTLPRSHWFYFDPFKLTG